jgi:hypothetical protein
MPERREKLFILTEGILDVREGLIIPLKEAGKEQPRAILGMFDVSARPMIEKDVLALAMPYSVFLKLLENVKGSFLETESWKKVLQRIQK